MRIIRGNDCQGSYQGSYQVHIGESYQRIISGYESDPEQQNLDYIVF